MLGWKCVCSLRVLFFFFFWTRNPAFLIYLFEGKAQVRISTQKKCPLWILCVHKCIGMLFLCINVYMLLFLNFSTFITILKNKSLEYWFTRLLACNSLSQDHKRSNISLNVCPDKYKRKLRKGQIYVCFPIPELLQSVLSNLFISHSENKLLKCEYHKLCMTYDQLQTSRGRYVYFFRNSPISKFI